MIEEKLNRESQEQQMYEQKVAHMEKEELQLINRLKNTKIIEEQAHHQLESAINDPLKPGTSVTSQSALKRNGTTKPQSSTKSTQK